MSPSSSIALLRGLAALINDGIETIETQCAKRSLHFPNLNEHTLDTESTKNVPEIANAISVIVAAAGQITAIVQPAHEYLFTACLQYQLSAALFTSEALNIPEILRTAGTNGMSTSDLAARVNTDSRKLSTIMRVLATEHIFIETAPEVFANNRISALLDSGKALDNLQPKFTTDCKPFPAFINEFWDHSKHIGYLSDYMRDPEWVFSDEPNKTMYNMVTKSSLTYFEHMMVPENENKRQTFGLAMSAQNQRTVNGFDWSSLRQSATVVDVGGGVGSAAYEIAKQHQQLRIIIQDLPFVESDSLKFWSSNDSDALESGRVSFLSHDFFQPQPVHHADVYLVRSVLHDWSDTHCVRLLRHLRNASGPASKLVVFDSLLNHAVKEKAGILLENRGHASFLGHALSLHMTATLNGQERTLLHLQEILENSGWELDYIRRPDASYMSIVVAVPAGATSAH